ncbi:MAG TPA: hypothetical protein VF613_14850 [Longimicrobium sp.]|jgi:hypothetical protein
MPSTNETTLADLLAEIETAWEERGDDQVAERLAAAHPEHADDLYAFFEAITTDDGELPPGVGAAAVRNTLAWLREEHEPPVGDPPPAGGTGGAPGAPPRNLMGLLCDESGKDPGTVASAIEDAPLELITAFATYPRLVPDAARDEFASRSARALRIDEARVRRKFDDDAQLPMAASRHGAYAAPPSTYEELLRQFGVPARVRKLWIRFNPRP